MKINANRCVLCLGENVALSKELMEILACPACRRKLIDREDHLLCPACSLAFPVEDGIPVLLLDRGVRC